AALVPEVAVIGRDNLQVVRRDGLPQRLLIRHLAERWRAHPLRALEAWTRQVVFGEEEVLETGLTIDWPPTPTRQADRLDRARIRDVHDVEGGSSHLGKPDRAVGRLGLQLRWPSQRVILWLGLSGGERLGYEDVNRVAVLGVDHDEQIMPGGLLHRAEECRVV